MNSWKDDKNKKAMAIIRRSSQNQKDNTSEKTQDRELREYAAKHELELIHVEPIIETAFRSERRPKYHALMKRAEKENIRHVLFFVGSREARNLTDLEANEEKIKKGQLIVHHVSENKVYWKETPDSDYMTRGILAVTHKGESQVNSTKMKASYKTKALDGWWPYRHTPCGYVHFKQKDEVGNPIKGTAKLVRDPDERYVRLAQEEFRLRALGLPYDEIRRLNLESKIVPTDLIRTYHRSSIEKRLKNSLYWGWFQLCGDPKIYQGKHELIIPKKHLDAVNAINKGHNLKVRNVVSDEDAIFRGWIHCSDPECRSVITFARKEKKLKSTNKVKVYNLYYCPNSKKVHNDKIRSASEEKIWEQLAPAVEAITISQEFAKDVTDALNETKVLQQKAIKKQMEGFRIELRNLETREDDAYTDFKKQILDDSGYQRQVSKIRDERKHFENEIERLTLQINDEGMASVQKVLELAINAKSLWISMNRVERLQFIKSVCQNQELEGLTLRFQLKSPFARLSNWKENQDWRRE